MIHNCYNVWEHCTVTYSWCDLGRYSTVQYFKVRLHYASDLDFSSELDVVAKKKNSDFCNSSFSPRCGMQLTLLWKSHTVLYCIVFQPWLHLGVLYFHFTSHYNSTYYPTSSSWIHDNHGLRKKWPFCDGAFALPNPIIGSCGSIKVLNLWIDGM